MNSNVYYSSGPQQWGQIPPSNIYPPIPKEEPTFSNPFQYVWQKTFGGGAAQQQAIPPVRVQVNVQPSYAAGPMGPSGQMPDYAVQQVRAASPRDRVDHQGQDDYNYAIQFSLAEKKEAEGDLEEALKCYENALRCRNHHDALKKVISLSQDLGNENFEKATAEPKDVRQSVRNLVQFIRHSKHNEEITRSLGAWYGAESLENQTLNALGQSEETEQIISDGRKCVELMRKCYDGQGSHLRPKQMPLEIKQDIELLEARLDYLEDHSMRLRAETLQFVYDVRHAKYAKDVEKALGGWLGAYSEDNREFDNLGTYANKSEDKGQKAVELIEKAYDGVGGHFRPDQMPKKLKKRLEEMKQLVYPNYSVKKAAEFYNRAYTLAPKEFPYFSRLVEAYSRSGDVAKAQALQVAKASDMPANQPVNFPAPRQNVYVPAVGPANGPGVPIPPQAPRQHVYGPSNVPGVTIPPVQVPAFHQVAMPRPTDNQSLLAQVDGHIANGNYSHAIDLLEKTLVQTPKNVGLQVKLSQVHYMVGNQFYKNQNNYNMALFHYLKAINCGVAVNPSYYDQIATVYAEKARVIMRLRNIAEKTGNIDAVNFCSYKAQQYQAEVINFRKKTVDLDQSNAAYLREYARAVHFDGRALDDAAVYLERAIRVEPKNLSTLCGLWVIYKGLYGQQSDKCSVYLAKFAQLGGNMFQTENYWKNPFFVPQAETFAETLYGNLGNYVDEDFRAYFRQYF